MYTCSIEDVRPLAKKRQFSFYYNIALLSLTHFERLLKNIHYFVFLTKTILPFMSIFTYQPRHFIIFYSITYMYGNEIFSID